MTALKLDRDRRRAARKAQYNMRSMVDVQNNVHGWPDKADRDERMTVLHPTKGFRSASNKRIAASLSNGMVVFWETILRAQRAAAKAAA